MELKIFIYWIILTIVFRLSAFIEHRIDSPNVKFKYYSGVFTNIFWIIWYIGLFISMVWIFIQLTTIFFKIDLF